MDQATLDLELYRLLRRVHTATRRGLHTLFAEHDLTGAQYWTLVRIPEDGIPLTSLAAVANADPANISGIVARLERDGLLRRRPDARDRRVSLICLTEAGKKRLAEVTPHYRAAVSDSFARLDSAQKQQLHTLLQSLIDDRESDMARAEAQRLRELSDS